MFADEDVYRRFEKHNYVVSFIHCHGICVYIVFSLLIARLMRTFPVGYKISLCGVVVRYSSDEPMVQGSSPTKRIFPFFFFFPVFVLLFSINI